ncbi:MAG: citrate/2-methylcitrate synthase [Vampirovibrionales bacterium]|nr:citrate/2-methylcitrate synthase [Vampirovibrionales bacterium]
MTTAATPLPYSPGLEGVIAGPTSISKVDSQRCSLVYRGYDVQALVEAATYEEIAYLLFHGELPNQTALSTFRQLLASHRELPPPVLAAIQSFPKTVHPMDALRAATALMALHDADVEDNSPEANLRKAIRLTAQFPTAIAAYYRASADKSYIAPSSSPDVSHAENFLRMMSGESPTPLSVKVFDMTLICYAEHGFNASTFAARVTASTESDLHSAVISAIGALKGPLHGGANEEAMKMLLEVGTVEKARTWMETALAEKRKIMGFGHREYKFGDPRARILKRVGKDLGEQLGQPHWDAMAAALEEVMLAEKSIHPNVDFPTAYIYYMLGLPIPVYTPIFALARIAGWSAHVMEQMAHNRLIRPKALYEGVSFRPFVALAERG